MNLHERAKRAKEILAKQRPMTYEDMLEHQRQREQWKSKTDTPTHKRTREQENKRTREDKKNK